MNKMEQKFADKHLYFNTMCFLLLDFKEQRSFRMSVHKCPYEVDEYILLLYSSSAQAELTKGRLCLLLLSDTSHGSTCMLSFFDLGFLVLIETISTGMVPTIWMVS